MVVVVDGVGASVVVVAVVVVDEVGAAVVVVADVVVVVPPGVVGAAVVVPGLVVVVCPEMFGDSANAGDTPPSTTLETAGTATALAASAIFTIFRRDTSTGSSGFCDADSCDCMMLHRSSGCRSSVSVKHRAHEHHHRGETRSAAITAPFDQPTTMDAAGPDRPIRTRGRVGGRARHLKGWEAPCSTPERFVLTHPVTLIRSSSLSDAAEYAYAATAPADSRLVFLAGSCPLNEDGSTAGIGDFAAQAAKCIENMKIALAAADADIENVISTRVLVASSRQADLVTAWEVVRDAFGSHDVPSTLLGVTVLGYDDQLVEIEAIAAVRSSEG